MHIGIHPTFKLWKGSVDARSTEAKPLYKIDKLVSIWVLFKPDFSILEFCRGLRYGKGPGCLRHIVTKFRSLNIRQGGRKYIHKIQFPEFLKSF